MFVATDRLCLPPFLRKGESEPTFFSPFCSLEFGRFVFFITEIVFLLWFLVACFISARVRLKWSNEN